MDLIVLGCSGSYPSPTSPCSGYLVRTGETTLWVDCGHGTFANFQVHAEIEDLDAVIITHEHPDHFVDLYGLHVLMRYGLDLAGLPVFAPPGAEERLGGLVSQWGDTFEWNVISDDADAKIGDLAVRFSRTDHPPPTFAVEISDDRRRLVYTADTGPDWTVGAFDPGADLVLSEATYQHAHRKAKLHLSARQAGEAAQDARAARLMITHLWPRLDPVVSVEEASEAFGQPVTLAAPHLVTRI